MIGKINETHQLQMADYNSSRNPGHLQLFSFHLPGKSPTPS